MDEFASLLEEEGPSFPPEDDPSSPAVEGIDELASLMEHDDSNNIDPVPPPSTKKSSSSISTSRSSSSMTVATAGIDDRFGIRMINRLVSSLDLLDLITTTGPYHSPARLSAMSLQALCGILVDPPSIVHGATVQGRTHLVTVGIVFENSGTKTSSKGAAFVILTIGSNLESGPCLSVFLFGSAYTKYAKISAGQVVAIINPKLFPTRDDKDGRSSDTSLSLSIYDISQLVHVAKARDYGVCKASVSGKQPNGTWRKNASNCKTFVDTRCGDYCPFHAKKEKAKMGHIANCSSMRAVGGVSSVSGTRGLNMVQEHKASRMPTFPSFQNTSNTAGSRCLENKPGRAIGNSVDASANSTRNINANRFLAVPQRHPPQYSSVQGISRIPMHLKKEDKRERQTMPVQSGGSSNTNRFTSKLSKRKVSETQLSAGPTTNKKEKTSSTAASGDWMEEAAARRKPPPKSLSNYVTNSGGKQVRKVNSAGCGLDGSVVVPGPSKLFTNRAPKISKPTTSSVTVNEWDETEINKIKEKQALLAEKLRGRETVSGLGQVAPRKISNSGLVGAKAKTTSSSGNAFLDSIQVDDLEAVLNAKSKFASEAEAEDYARKRRRMVELERLETKDKKRPGAGQDKENHKILVIWTCCTCSSKPRFTKYPKQCFSACHDVKKERRVKESTSKLDERTKLHEKGGLTLGSGLEWSKNPYNQSN